MRLILCLLLFSVNVFSQDIDTSLYTIIPIKKYPYAFPPAYKQATLSPKEINMAEATLSNCVIDYNTSLRRKYNNWLNTDSSQQIIGLKNNRRQYIAVINPKGEKELWVNFTPHVIYDDGRKDYSWKEDVTVVDDGGSSYFHLKVNLTKRICYDLFVNGH